MAIAETLPTSARSRATPEVLAAVATACLAVLAYFVTDDPLYAVLIGALPLAVVLCVHAPLAICVMFVAFSFFRLHEAYPFLKDLKIPLALGAAMGLSLTLHVAVLQSLHPFMTPALKRLLVLFALMIFGVPFAQDRSIAFNFVVDVYWKTILMTFAIAWLARTDRDFTFIGRTLVVSGLLVAAVAIFNRLAGIGLVEGTRVTIARVMRLNKFGDMEDAPAEFQSTLADPNDLALVLLFPLAFALSYALLKTNRTNRLLGIVGTIAIMAAIIFTQSRGGLIGVLAVFGALGLRFIKSRTVAITLCLVAGLGLAAAMGLRSRVSGGEAELSASESGIDDSAMGRIYAWGAAINMAARRPLTGVGVNNFSEAYYFFTDKWEKRDKAVHSTWFQVLGEMGIPGIVVFVMVVMATFRSALGSLRRLDACGPQPLLTATALSLVGGLAGFCAAGTFLTQAFTWPLYVMIGMAAALAQTSHRIETEQRPRVVTKLQPVVSTRPVLRGMLPGR